jgi:pyridoxal phosphate enzyme (YggS family)
MSVSENLHAVRQHILSTAQKYGRASGSVRLIAVSKTKPLELIREAYAAGQIDFGENRSHELVAKHAELPDARWHMIGHLQRRQVKDIIPFVYLIHSVDSDRLLEKINREAAACDRVVDCLLQLNISEEDAKSGLDETSAAAILARMDEWPNVRIMGLMGMAQIRQSEADTPVIRSQFARLRRAFETFSHIFHPRIRMQELSMGMSDDLEEAIAEGATMVRIGTAVFGNR